MKKKPSGLAKKIPTIFEGIPEIEQEESEEKGTPQETKQEAVVQTPEKEQPKKITPQPSGPLKFFIEIGEFDFSALIAERRVGQWYPINVMKRSFEDMPAASMDEESSIALENLKGFLKELLEEYPKLTPEVNILWLKKGVYYEEIEKPEVLPEEMQDAILWQIAEGLPFPVEDAKVQYQEREETVIVSAIEKNEVEKVLSCFHDSQLYPSMLTVVPVAYQGVFTNKSGVVAPNSMVIHLSEEQSSLMVFNNGAFESVRETDFGGRQITEAMVGTLVVDDSTLEINLEQAQELKESLGIPTKGLAPDPEEPKLSQLAARMRPFCEKIADEGQRAVRQANSQGPERAIQEVVLAGSEAELRGFDQYLEDQIGLPVKIFPIEKIDSKLDLSVSALAGLSRLESSEFNFAAEEDIIKPKLEKVASWVKKVVIILSIGLAIISGIKGFNIFMMHQKNNAQLEQLYDLGASPNKLEQYEKLLLKNANQEVLIFRTVGRRPKLGGVLKELSYIIPRSVVLRTVQFEETVKGREIAFTGYVRSSNGQEDSILAQFMEKMNESSAFDGARLEQRAKAEPGESGVKFLIKTNVRLPDGR